MPRLDLEAEHSADLRIVDEVIVRLRSRLATCDDSELPSVGALLLKYLERRAAMLGLDQKPKGAASGSIAEATKRLELVTKKTT
jgi:hypothetical protein